ncbi:hypothetical protein Tco_1232834 [Tanacetum coccineum]
MKRGYAGDIVPLLPAMLAGAAVDQGEGSAQPAEPHHTPVDPSPPHPSPPHPSPLHHSPPHSPLQSPPYSPPHYSPPRSYEAPLPEGNTSGSAEASMQLRELMVLVPTLVTRINSLEKELKDTKQTLGNAVLKLVKKVKSLETALKRKSKKVIISESEGEEPEDQGRIIQDIDDDPLVSLVRESMKEKSTDFVTPTKALGEAQEEEISPTILEAAKTLSKVASQGVSKEKSTDKGKRYKRRARSMDKKIDTGLDAEKEINAGIKEVSTCSTKVDSAQLDEEVAKQIRLDKMIAKRMAEEEALTEQQKKRKAQIDTFVPINLEATKAKLKRYGEELQSKTLKKQRFDDKDVPAIGKKLLKKMNEVCYKLLKMIEKQDGISDEVISSSGHVFGNYGLLWKRTSFESELLQIKEMADQDTPPPTITAMKIPIIKKGEYDIWNLEDEATPSGEQSSPLVPKTAKQLAARRNQERIKSILLLAIPDEYLLKFHNVPDAKSLWAAIKSRFGGNEESKKMQKNVLKHQFENFVTASNETLDKAYDRFQKLISQLEIHGAYVSKEDINQKFLRSLPPSWSQIALIMRNKPDIDEIDIDDLYNNLRVYEDELKRSSGSNSASQNLAFLSSENTNSTNEVSTASGDFRVSTAGGINQVPSTPSAHDIAYSFLAQPTTSPQLENEDFQQMDGDDLEELDLRWQVAMLTVRVKKFIQRTGRNLDFKEK